jgi:hypothetical protein
VSHEDGATLAAEAFVLRSGKRRILMLIALAAFLTMGWILAFFVLDVTTLAVHTLVFAAGVSVLVHFIHVHRVARPPRAPL